MMMPNAPQGASPRGALPQGAPMGRESMLNPIDAVKKTQTGEVRPDMTIREFFAGQGLDVDTNTVADMSRFLAGQVQNRTMEGKLGGMSPGGTPGQGMPMAPGLAPQPKPGLQGLMGKLGA